MEQSIKAVEALVNFILSSGAVKNHETATQVTNTLSLIKQEVAQVNNKIAELESQLQPKEVKSNPIPKQSGIKPLPEITKEQSKKAIEQSLEGLK